MKVVAFRGLHRSGKPATDWIDGAPHPDERPIFGQTFELAYGGPAILQWVPEDELSESIHPATYAVLFPHSRIDNGIREFPIFAPGPTT